MRGVSTFPGRGRFRGRYGRRGLTLLELVVGSFIALFLTSAAVVFATHETRLLGHASEQVEMQDSARAALDLLAEDFQLAGAGIGLDAAGNYAGLQTGPFTAIGGLPLNAAGTDPSGAYTELALRASDASGAEAAALEYVMRTEDLGIISATGPYATIALHAGSAGQYCDDGSVLPGNETQYVAIQTEDRLGIRSALFSPGALNVGCTFGRCVTGCRQFTLAPDPAQLYESAPSAAGLSFTGGEVHTRLRQIVWLVENDAQDRKRALLRRAELTALPGARCRPGGRGSCGFEVARNVETLQFQVWRYDPSLTDILATTYQDERWVAVASGPIRTANRLRVDVELVMRSERQQDRPIAPAELALRPGHCAPNVGSACPTSPAAWDRILRRTHRISVEIKNSQWLAP